MSSTRLPTHWIIRAGIVLAATLGLVASCVSHDQPRPVCGELADGGVAFFHPEGAPYDASPSTDAQAATAFGMEPDPGPQCLDCAQGGALDFMTMADFEDGFAPAWFNYGEPGIPLEPGQASNLDGGSIPGPGGLPMALSINVPSPYWGLQATELRSAPGGSRCGSQYALHMTGGRFVSWGGGFATLYATIRGGAQVNEQCINVPDERLRTQPTPDAPNPWAPDLGVVGDTCGVWMTPVEATQPARLGLDASAYDGLSFWARRGPSGQATLRISILDDATSTGLALSVERDAYFAKQRDPNADVEEPACKRIVECCRHCEDVTFQPYDAGAGPDPERGIELGTDGVYEVGGYVTEKRCRLPHEPIPQYLLPNETETRYIDAGVQPERIFIGPPGADPFEPDSGIVAGGESAMQTAYDTWRRDYKLCCSETMEQNPNDGDPKFGGAECAPYVFNFDYSSGYYCQPSEGERLPERNENRCEDGFEANVLLDTEWRLFTIPWSELRRSTPNRPPIDPRGIWKVAFYFGPGYLDTYVDDIGFYRKRH